MTVFSVYFRCFNILGEFGCVWGCLLGVFECVWVVQCAVVCGWGCGDLRGLDVLSVFGCVWKTFVVIFRCFGCVLEVCIMFG